MNWKGTQILVYEYSYKHYSGKNSPSVQQVNGWTKCGPSQPYKGMEIVTCYMDEPWKHGAKWNKPDTKGQVLYNLP